ncbi:hypothetical protein NQ318_016607 [Aromia moschata]|uniref:Uncharacterized protein n=1 Tax=Aromia moschata TaxID=1265417 RepID=A0AAV8XYR2_9CUCU|nr:hypothetical protein NQ318_016607 [Aromia moschata]
MLSVQMEQRVNLKFLIKPGKTFTEAYAMLKEGGQDSKLWEAVKAKATDVLNQLIESDFQHCFQQCKRRMGRAVEIAKGRTLKAKKLLLYW